MPAPNIYLSKRLTVATIMKPSATLDLGELCLSVHILMGLMSITRVTVDERQSWAPSSDAVHECTQLSGQSSEQSNKVLEAVQTSRRH